jgi:hypothetical protein
MDKNDCTMTNNKMVNNERLSVITKKSKSSHTTPTDNSYIHGMESGS